VRVADFAGSEMFQRLFKEGMELVEETASYLDGPGRDDAKRWGAPARSPMRRRAWR
jgi:regulator of CtrA degradation